MPDLYEPNPVGIRTICEVHRQLYRALQKRGDRELMELVAEAFDMGKKLSNKLRQYKFDFDDGWWEQNKLVGGSVDEPETSMNNGH